MTILKITPNYATVEVAAEEVLDTELGLSEELAKQRSNMRRDVSKFVVTSFIGDGTLEVSDFPDETTPWHDTEEVEKTPITPTVTTSRYIRIGGTGTKKISLMVL